MKNIDWNNVQDETTRPEPGGYIAKIVDVEDNEQKECLFIKWDFAEGALKGANRNTYDAHGFWPTILSRSYKPTALSFFKGFKTAIEESNRGYTFNNDPSGFCVTLGKQSFPAASGTLTNLRNRQETRTSGLTGILFCENAAVTAGELVHIKDQNMGKRQSDTMKRRQILNATQSAA